MSDHDEFWRHVNAALDERRDPLDDEGVQRLIGEEPELLEAVHCLEHGLTLTRRAVPSRPILLALAAAVIVVLFGTWLVARESSAREPRYAARDERVSRVLSYQLSVTRVDERGTETITYDGFGSSRTFVDRDGNVVRNSIQLTRAETPGNKP